MKVFIPGNPIQNGPISRQEYIQLLEAVRAMARAMDVQAQGGLSASWGPGGLAISAPSGSRSTPEGTQATSSHPFQVTTYTSSGSVVIGVAAGVVNNALQIAKTQLSYTSPMYPAVAVVFTINADGTVVPSSASLVTNKVPTDPHVVISGSAVTVYCFLAKVETVSGASTVQQWLTGNFFVSPLGYQKQLWYA